MRKFLITLFTLSFSSLYFSQSKLVLGLNIGAYKSQNKTAAMYNGVDISSSVSNYHRLGFNFIYNNSFYKANIDNYYQYPYEIVEYPTDLRYNISFDVGGMIGLKGENGGISFIESNVSQLKVQDVYVVEINNPNTTNPEADLQQEGIFGLEQRLTLNLGYMPMVSENNNIKVYVPFFVNMNNVKVKQNYILVGSQKYAISHNIQGITNTRIGGTGFGAGTGISVHYDMGKYTIGLQYKAIFNQTRMLEDFKEMGLNHTFGLNVIWQ